MIIVSCVFVEKSFLNCSCSVLICLDCIWSTNKRPKSKTKPDAKRQTYLLVQLHIFFADVVMFILNTILYYCSCNVCVVTVILLYIYFLCFLLKHFLQFFETGVHNTISKYVRLTGLFTLFARFFFLLL